jgi:purine-cytosine permease-like protein
MAMHIGMSDLTVLRYARKSWYAIASGAGMYIGHFMAWISASILYAYQIHLNPGDTDVLPGPMAFKALGYVGLLCVIIAGWTTANPTIYRAGLAFQAILKRVSVFKVTLLTGAIATLAGLFPAIAMKLLGFVAIYGMVLMPMGAVVFADFWLLKKFGLQDFFAERSKSMFNPAAGSAWIVTLVICVLLVKFAGIQIYFVSLPGWFVASVIYILVSWIYQKKIKPSV